MELRIYHRARWGELLRTGQDLVRLLKQAQVGNGGPGLTLAFLIYHPQ